MFVSHSKKIKHIGFWNTILLNSNAALWLILCYGLFYNNIYQWYPGWEFYVLMYLSVFLNKKLLRIRNFDGTVKNCHEGYNLDLVNALLFIQKFKYLPPMAFT